MPQSSLLDSSKSISVNDYQQFHEGYHFCRRERSHLFLKAWIAGLLVARCFDYRIKSFLQVVLQCLVSLADRVPISMWELFGYGGLKSAIPIKFLCASLLYQVMRFLQLIDFSPYSPLRAILPCWKKFSNSSFAFHHFCLVVHLIVSYRNKAQL